MRLSLTDKERAFRSQMREFFTTEIPAGIRERVLAGQTPTRDDIVTAMQTMNTHGLAVPGWPTAWGGREWTPMQFYLWNLEMQMAGVPKPLPFNAAMIGPVLAQFASTELCERFLPATANADIWWAQGFSEPNAGSDLASLTTSARRDGDTWVINGQKTWTTQAQHADWIFCLARTDPNADRPQRGISMLLVPMSAQGLTRRPIKLVDGSMEVNEIFFDDVRVPCDHLVGDVNSGWTQAKFLLGNERAGTAPVGAIKRSLASAKRHANEIGALPDPRLSARFIELETALLALELTAVRVAASSKDGKPNTASSVLKLRGTELTQAVTELTVDIAGRTGISAAPSAAPAWASAAIPTYLNLRKLSIYGGSNEIQRQIIARQILGM